MNTNGKKVKKLRTKGKHLRFPIETLTWLETQARQEGYASDTELLRQIVREYRQQVEQAKAATA